MVGSFNRRLTLTNAFVRCSRLAHGLFPTLPRWGQRLVMSLSSDRCRSCLRTTTEHTSQSAQRPMIRKARRRFCTRLPPACREWPLGSFKQASPLTQTDSLSSRPQNGSVLAVRNWLPLAPRMGSPATTARSSNVGSSAGVCRNSIVPPAGSGYSVGSYPQIVMDHPRRV